MKKSLLSLSMMFLVTGLFTMAIHAQELPKTKVQIKVQKNGKTTIDTILYFEKGISEEAIHKAISDLTGEESLEGRSHWTATMKTTPESLRDRKFVVIERDGKEDTLCIRPEKAHGVMVFTGEDKPGHVTILKGEGKDSILTYTISTGEGEATWTGSKGSGKGHVYVTTTVEGEKEGEKTVIIKTITNEGIGEFEKQLEYEVNVAEGDSGTKKVIIIEKEGKDDHVVVREGQHVHAEGEVRKEVKVVEIDEQNGREGEKNVVVIVDGKDGQKKVITGEEMTVTTDEKGNQITIIIKKSDQDMKTDDSNKQEVKKGKKK